MNGDVIGSFGLLEAVRSLYKTKGGSSGHCTQYRICIPMQLLPCRWNHKDQIRMKRVELNGEDAIVLQKVPKECSTTNLQITDRKCSTTKNGGLEHV